MVKKVLSQTRIALLLAACLFAIACTKSDESTEQQPKTLQKIIVKEYPGLTPASGAIIQLNRLDGWGNAVEVGTFTTNSKGMVETDKTFSAKASRVLMGAGYIPVNMQNDTLKIPEYYVARPCWVNLKVRNISPANNEDFCYIYFSQKDTLNLPVTQVRPGWAGSSGWEKYFQGATINQQYTLMFAANVPFYMSVARTKNTLGVPVIDHKTSYIRATSDTLSIAYEY